MEPVEECGEMGCVPPGVPGSAGVSARVPVFSPPGVGVRALDVHVAGMGDSSRSSGLGLGSCSRIP